MRLGGVEVTREFRICVVRFRKLCPQAYTASRMRFLTCGQGRKLLARVHGVSKVYTPHILCLLQCIPPSRSIDSGGPTLLSAPGDGTQIARAADGGAHELAKDYVGAFFELVSL